MPRVHSSLPARPRVGPIFHPLPSLPALAWLLASHCLWLLRCRRPRNGAVPLRYSELVDGGRP